MSKNSLQLKYLHITKPTMADPKQQFEKLSQDFSNQQASLNELMGVRSKLETQYQENKIVLEEFQNLNEDSKIYKLTGPILLPQEFAEAKMNVDKRIEFIEEEIKRVEVKISAEEKSIESTRDNILAVRSQLGQQQQQ